MFLTANYPGTICGQKMVDDENAKINFSTILNTIGRKFDIIHMKWLDSKEFEAKFRTEIDRDNEDFNGLCDQWVDVFSDVTNTVWAKKISNTGPKIRFRKQYQCWTHDGKIVHKELLFDPKKCKATLDIKVLTDNPLTRRKNKHIRMGLNVVVKINFIHLHDVDTRHAFSFFVHNCKPLSEPPPSVIHPNERLPQLVAEMVQKGPSTSQKLAKDATDRQNNLKRISTTEQKGPNKIHVPCVSNATSQNGFQKLHSLNDTSLNSSNLSNVEPHPIPLLSELNSVDSVKLELPPLSQFTQVVVSGPQMDMPDSMLMCQPFMFDASQVIPLNNHNLPAHFVQIHNMQNQQHFL